MGNLIIKHSVPRVKMIKGIYYLSISKKKLSIQIINLRCLILYLPFQGGASFVDHFCCLYLSLLYCLVCSLQSSDNLLGRTDLLVLLCMMFSFGFVTFPYGVPGQMSYLIVSYPNIFLLPYFNCTSVYHEVCLPCFFF